jgi:FtsH-binding integral membrane protein
MNDMNPASPHLTLTKLVEKVGANSDSWALPTVGLVILVTFIVSQVRDRKQPSLRRVQLWAVSVVGWVFFVAMELIDLLAAAQVSVILALLASTALVSVTNLIVADRSPGLAHVLVAVILSMLVFTAIACLAYEDRGGSTHATAILMGTLLGFLLSEAIINLRMWLGSQAQARPALQGSFVRPVEPPQAAAK